MEKTNNIRILYEAFSSSQQEYETIKQNGYMTSKKQISQHDSGFCDIMTVNHGNKQNAELTSASQNFIHLGDNLEYMCSLIREKNMAGRIKLIYIDPPFFTLDDHGASFSINSKKTGKIPLMKQQAFKDKWNRSNFEYFKMMSTRLFLMHDLLSDDGSIFVHLDRHAVHQVKLLMDEIFGEERFVNEIIWNYKSGGVSKRYFARKHDNILFYSKTKNYYFVPQKEKSYNRGYKPYRFKGVEEFQDERGWYTLVNRKDVWQMDMLGRSSHERVNYATQKPEALVRRILESCTNEGDICADFFCGSGTLGAAASEMNRRFICCDAGTLAVSNTVKRILHSGADFTLSESVSNDDIEDVVPQLNDSGNETAGNQGGSAGMIAGNPRVTAEYDGSCITLTGYDINLKDVHLIDKSYPFAVEVLEKDPLAFIDFWCVAACSDEKNDAIDSENDKSVFRPDMFFTRDSNNDIDFSVLANAAYDGKAPDVWAFDMFGNRITVEVLYI